MCSSSDLFNLLTDGDARYDGKSCLKNKDNWLLFAPNLQILEEKIINLMEFCKKKNLKLNPDKTVTGNGVWRERHQCRDGQVRKCSLYCP